MRGRPISYYQLYMMGYVEPFSLNIVIEMLICSSHFLFFSSLVTEMSRGLESLRDQKVSGELLCSLTCSCKAE